MGHVSEADDQSISFSLTMLSPGDDDEDGRKEDEAWNKKNIFSYHWWELSADPPTTNVITEETTIVCRDGLFAQLADENPEMQFHPERIDAALFFAFLVQCGDHESTLECFIQDAWWLKPDDAMKGWNEWKLDKTNSTNKF